MTLKARINREITAQQVRLLDPEGNMLGVVSTTEALRVAGTYNLDLVEISPNAEPPVCKVMDYGKYRYEQEKRDQKARKNQKVIELKEVRLRPSIAEGDLQIKIRNLTRFLAEGDKVKITVVLRGREMAHSEIAMQLAENIKSLLADVGKVDVGPKFEGRQIILLLSPALKSDVAAKFIKNTSSNNESNKNANAAKMPNKEITDKSTDIENNTDKVADIEKNEKEKDSEEARDS